jgi:hypothetical protein
LVWRRSEWVRVVSSEGAAAFAVGAMFGDGMKELLQVD